MSISKSNLVLVLIFIGCSVTVLQPVALGCYYDQNGGEDEIYLSMDQKSEAPGIFLKRKKKKQKGSNKLKRRNRQMGKKFKRKNDDSLRDRL